MKHSILFSAAAAGILLLCLPALLKLSLHLYKFYIFAGILLLSLSVILPALTEKQLHRSKRPAAAR